ncbi:MAG TPA: hypothetical protein VL948_03610 [Verrucomicrobiae bacterium]|jgi:hypothetical protein|nr:hypothetical protein [Verrucomicrobiae bacterium]
MARPYKKHGLVGLQRAIRVRGIGALDGRSKVSRALIGWRRALEHDMGAPGTITAQQAAVLDSVVVTRLLLDSIDAWLLEQDGGTGIVNRKRRAVFPVVAQRQALADSLLRHLTALGLERRRAAATDEQEIVRAVRADLSRARRPRKRNEIPVSPQEPTSPPEPMQESGVREIAAPCPQDGGTQG